jgi:hypothetical protein
MRLDADEYLTPELTDELAQRLADPDLDVIGYYLKRRVYFMRKWIRHGDYYPISLLRVWRSGQAKCETRWMDEHMVIQGGKTMTCHNDFVDENLNNLTWWAAKHNGYATRAAVDFLLLRHRLREPESEGLTGQAHRKRWLKERFYARLPLGIRVLMYFLYRYFLRLGFLDGLPGMFFHVLQGFCHPYLVDAKIFEIEEIARRNHESLPSVLRKSYGVEL